jgi:hypothetical protein
MSVMFLCHNCNIVLNCPNNVIIFKSCTGCNVWYRSSYLCLGTTCFPFIPNRSCRQWSFSAVGVAV